MHYLLISSIRIIPREAEQDLGIALVAAILIIVALIYLLIRAIYHLLFKK